MLADGCETRRETSSQKINHIWSVREWVVRPKSDRELRKTNDRNKSTVPRNRQQPKECKHWQQIKWPKFLSTRFFKLVAASAHLRVAVFYGVFFASILAEQESQFDHLPKLAVAVEHRHRRIFIDACVGLCAPRHHRVCHSRILA